jgi:dihydroorotase
MKILIKQVKIIDQASAHHNKILDVLIEDGIIKTTANRINESADKIIEGKGHCLSIGWFDLHVNFREPGHEYKEDLLSGCRAAMAGGFTEVLCMPSTFPPIQSKSEIEMIRTKTRDELVNVHVAGVLSLNREGKDLSEMYDMHTSGALAFTDDKKAVQDSGLMLRALMYAKNFNGLILSYADDKYLSAKGQMNESISSTHLGLKGIPSLAEELMLNRDIFLNEYADGRIHFSSISSAKSVQIIRNAKASGIKLTCDVAAYNILLDDSALSRFDTNFKVKPPLRTKEDINAIIEGLVDGTIDSISSDHSPEDIENKRKEFDLAAFGMIGLETAYAVANTALQKIMESDKLVDKFAVGPRKILGLRVPVVKEGEKANLTLFNPEEEWTVENKDLQSKSKNTPFVGMKLRGRVKGVFNNGKFSEVI